MGFLSFLSRKSNNEGTAANLKAQRYSATVAAPPPVRGSAPVAGNGPSLLEIYQKQHHKINKAAFGPSGSGALLPDSTREVDVEELFAEEPIYRPRTAPSRARTRKGPSTPRQKGKARGPPYRLPDKEPSVSGGSFISKGTASYAQDSAISIRSGVSGASVRHVDLLDAQSSFKPANFHQRLHATGARGYGEDVADRNLGENTVDVHSVHARAFYDSAARGDGAAPTHDRRGPDADMESAVQPNWRHSLAAYSRAKSLLSSDQILPSPRLSEYMPQQSTAPEADPVTNPAARRTADRPKSLHLSILSASTDHAASVGEDRASEDFMTDRGLELQAAQGPIVGRRREESRESAGPHRSDSGPRVATPISARTLPASFSYRSPYSTVVQSPRVIPSLSRHDFESTDEYHAFPAANTQLQAAPSPRASSHRYSASLASSCSRSTRGYEIQDSIPERTSSLHQWSLASPSPTVSTHSSNPFRPQSRHTAETSIEIPRSAKSGHQSRHSLASDSYRSTRHSRTQSSSTRMSTSSSGRPDRRISPPADFDIDDDISSDDDTKTIHESPDESALLFRNTGYGAQGMELPGISGIDHDALLLPPKQYGIPKSVRQDSLRVPGYGIDGQSRRWRNRDDYSDEESDDDELSFDIPLSRPGTARRQFPRLDRYGQHKDAIEEERFSGDYTRRSRSGEWKGGEPDAESRQDRSGNERFDGRESDSDIEWATPTSGLH